VQAREADAPTNSRKDLYTAFFDHFILQNINPSFLGALYGVAEFTAFGNIARGRRALRDLVSTLLKAIYSNGAVVSPIRK
jgi:hypothetical protein